MDEREAVSALIDRIVRDARIPGRGAREELRRELQSHFDDAGNSPGALRRFGNQAQVAEGFRRAYRWDYFALYLAKVAVSIIASVMAALLIQVLVNLRVEVQAEALRLAPGFSKAAVLSVAVVLALVTAWEAVRKPFDIWRASIAIATYGALCLVVQSLFDRGFQAFGPAAVLVAIGYACSRLEWRSPRLALTFGVFAAAIYLIHLSVSVALGPARALATSAILVAVWACTMAILSLVDHAFLSVFSSSEKGSV
jgi:hypothetical protein